VSVAQDSKESLTRQSHLILERCVLTWEIEIRGNIEILNSVLSFLEEGKKGRTAYDHM
jgi:hypothetical protein